MKIKLVEMTDGALRRIRIKLTFRFIMTVVVLLACVATSAFGDQPIPPVNQRFSDSAVNEIPSFQKHIVPLFGRLGCSGRSCHGSFQGRGGFRLSLFGYDFKADHNALTDKDDP